MTARPHQHDVVVVGARAAGAATALLLAQLGHDVVVLDRAAFPADTISTHQIARPGVVQLGRWGLLDDVLSSGAPALRALTLHIGGQRIRRTVPDAAGVDLLVAPRRQILDTLLADAAGRAGADVRLGVTVSGVRRDRDGRAVGIVGHDSHGRLVEVGARFVVGADGLSSGVARSVGAPVTEWRGADGAAQYAYYAGVPWDGIELHVADGAVAGVFPTHAGEAAIWVSSSARAASEFRRRAASRAAAFSDHLARVAPSLTERLASGRRVSPVTGMLRMPNQLRQAAGPGWALVGDAGYHRDAVTGLGLSDAYRDAELLADALHAALTGTDEAMALTGYHLRRDAMLRELFEITCAIAAYPSATEIVALQKELAAALDRQAADLNGSAPHQLRFPTVPGANPQGFRSFAGVPRPRIVADMTEFLVEVYVPRNDHDAIALATAGARQAAESLTRDGDPVRFVRSIFVPEDETCFLLFEAASLAAVHRAVATAGLPCDGIHETAGQDLLDPTTGGI